MLLWIDAGVGDDHVVHDQRRPAHAPDDVLGLRLLQEIDRPLVLAVHIDADEMAEGAEGEDQSVVNGRRRAGAVAHFRLVLVVGVVGVHPAPPAGAAIVADDVFAALRELESHGDVAGDGDAAVALDARMLPEQLRLVGDPVGVELDPRDTPSRLAPR